MASLDSPDWVIRLEIYCGNVHRNITCDICNSIVIGDRYKCLQCDDFDICQCCFQANYGVHDDHCMLLLRTEADSSKFLRSIPGVALHGADFRVVDIDLAHIDIGGRPQPSSVATQTVIVANSDKGTDSCLLDAAAPIPTTATTATMTMGESMGDTDQDQDKEKVANGEEERVPVAKDDAESFLDESVSEADYAGLPDSIKAALDTLRSMGFNGVSSTLIALLVANNGNIYNVLEELEYSAKH